MSSFPNSVVSFSAKSAGQTIQPTHVTDLQDEVTAIEQGYLQGTAQLNSSNSTLANLSVSGKSTLVGNVQMNGNSTIAGDVAIGGNLTVTGAITHAGGGQVLVTNSARAQIPNAAFTGLNWDNEIKDVSGMHSTSVNSSRLTFVTSSGLWLVGLNATWDTSTGGVRIIRILHSVSSVVGESIIERATTANDAGHGVTAMIYVTSTAEYCTADCFQNNGSTASLSSGTPTQFWAMKI